MRFPLGGELETETLDITSSCHSLLQNQQVFPGGVIVGLEEIQRIFNPFFPPSSQRLNPHANYYSRVACVCWNERVPKAVSRRGRVAPYQRSSCKFGFEQANKELF